MTSIFDGSKLTPEQEAERRERRRSSDAAAARYQERFDRDRVAHDALAAKDRAAGAVRLAEQALARARADLEEADRDFDRTWPRSSCVCYRCSGERATQAQSGR